MTIGSCSFCHWLPMESSLDTIFYTRVMASATVGCGYNVPPLLGPAEYGGGVQWKWSLLLQQTVFIQYCTSDWISTPPTLVDTCQVNDIWKDGLGRVSKSALYKLWHMAAKLSHETNLAITKLSVSPIHNTIGLGLPIFINVTTRQQISIYSISPYWYLLAGTPHIWKSGGTKKFFREFFCTPHLKICGTALASKSHCKHKFHGGFHIGGHPWWWPLRNRGDRRTKQTNKQTDILQQGHNKQKLKNSIIPLPAKMYGITPVMVRKLELSN